MFCPTLSPVPLRSFFCNKGFHYWVHEGALLNNFRWNSPRSIEILALKEGNVKPLSYCWRPSPPLLICTITLLVNVAQVRPCCKSIPNKGIVANPYLSTASLAFPQLHLYWPHHLYLFCSVPSILFNCRLDTRIWASWVFFTVLIVFIYTVLLLLPTR